MVFRSVQPPNPLLIFFWCAIFGLLGSAGPAHAQVIVANDDLFSVPLAFTLVVEPFGVLENDLLDDEAAGELGATAELLSGVSYGTLTFSPDGGFSYWPDSTYDGTDTFVYRAVFGAAADTATVTLSACSGGPDVYDCWKETAFLAKASELGLSTFQEGFEDDAAWGIARHPNSAPVVVSQGVEWRSNHPDPPASNNVTTAPGAAYTGLWGGFDPDHGYATGTPTECDIDDPPLHCTHHDGLSGTRVAGQSPLHGVGGYFSGIYGAKVAFALDGGAPFGSGLILFGYQFLGVIDARPAGFTHFECVEVDGKIGQALYVWMDDFTLLTSAPTEVEALPGGAASGVRFGAASPNPSHGNTSLRFTLPERAVAELTVHDVHGRLVRHLRSGVRGEGWHEVTWSGRDREGKDVGSGVYFARLVVELDGEREERTRKIVIGR